jgi:hypothetical protein
MRYMAEQGALENTGCRNYPTAELYRTTGKVPTSAEPLIVAKAIEHAIRSKRPRAHYPLTAGERMMLFSRRVLAQPRLGIRMQIKPPKP